MGVIEATWSATTQHFGAMVKEQITPFFAHVWCSASPKQQLRMELSTKKGLALYKWQLICNHCCNKIDQFLKYRTRDMLIPIPIPIPGPEVRATGYEPPPLKDQLRAEATRCVSFMGRPLKWFRPVWRCLRHLFKVWGNGLASVAMNEGLQVVLGCLTLLSFASSRLEVQQPKKE